MIELNKLHENMTYELYALEPGLRSSHLQALRRSPAHYKARLVAPDAPTPAMKFGNIFHKAIENPARFRDLAKVKPVFVGKTLDGRDSTRSKEAKLMEQEWLASNQDSIILTEEEMTKVTGMLVAVSKHKILAPMLKGCLSEVSLWTDDPQTGVRLKCRIDCFAADGYVIDFKTAEDARSSAFTNQVFSDRPRSPFYALPGAHYAYVTKSAGLSRGDHFVFVAIEPEPPHGIMVYTLDSGGLDVGETYRESLTRTFMECQLKDEWPCYPEKAVQLSIPQYVSTSHLDDPLDFDGDDLRRIAESMEEK